ncbi:MAG: hypothetical protein EA384_14605 [Spirochaetaceae bacterium]|nr:MAG: hypothetical protein EA384_14605 [Spirochaetaceae bacterium]
MVQKHVVLRALFGLYVVAGFAFVLFGTVQVVGAALPQSADRELELDVSIVKNRWQWEPDHITVEEGTLVRLHITNDDEYDHGFAISEFALDQRLPANSTTTVEFVASRAGDFTFFCSVYCGAGHFGQRGTLTVVSDNPARVVEQGPRPIETDLPIRGSSDRVERLQYTVVDGVKQFELSADPVMWDYGGGHIIESWGYNAQLPGPEIRVTENDRVRIVFTNNLDVATTVHWHGIDLENPADGVPGYTQRPIEPGETYIYEFNAYPAGTRFYHTHGSHHGDEARQMDMGLAGAFVIEPPDYRAPDVEKTWVLTERIRDGIFPINGAVYPETEPIRVGEGDRVRVRMINAGSATFHPMHLHGHQFKVVAVDGNPVPEVAQLTRNTLPILPGETYDVEFIANNPGLWLFHCHELNHAAGGMITAVIYNNYIGGEYTLTDHIGREVTQQDFEGRYKLVSFGYTNCADFCPQMMNEKADILELLGDDADQLAVLYVTIDPARDTPEVLANYIASFDERIVGLTGSDRQIAQVVEAFRVYYRKVESGSPDSYTFDHTTTMYLMGPDGTYVAHFDHQIGAAQRIAARVRDGLDKARLVSR